jgi:hypothetical protein
MGFFSKYRRRDDHERPTGTTNISSSNTPASSHNTTARYGGSRHVRMSSMFDQSSGEQHTQHARQRSALHGETATAGYASHSSRRNDENGRQKQEPNSSLTIGRFANGRPASQVTFIDPTPQDGLTLQGGRDNSDLSCSGSDTERSRPGSKVETEFDFTVLRDLPHIAAPRLNVIQQDIMTGVTASQHGVKDSKVWYSPTSPSPSGASYAGTALPEGQHRRFVAEGGMIAQPEPRSEQLRVALSGSKPPDVGSPGGGGWI